MRLVRYSTEDGPVRVGVVENDDHVIDLGRAGTSAGAELPDAMGELLADPEWRSKVERAVDVGRGSDAIVDRGAVELEAPITDPQKVVCVGLNYQEHVEESDGETPENPVLFAKFPSAIAAHEDEIRWDPELTSKVDFEAELAVVMGDSARRIDRTEAGDRIAGFTAANDVSARDLQFADEQWVRGKTLDTFCPLGPELVTTDEIDDPHDLAIWTEVNGRRFQESNTGDMIFDVYDLVSFCSQAFSLRPGDVILTGTPPGVGAFRDPPVYLGAGDEVAVGIEGVGELVNRCAHL